MVSMDIQARVMADRGQDDAAQFAVTLTLSVENVRALWAAAAGKALTALGMVLSDVIETIGPREDPSIEDCIAMLVGPCEVAGCTVEDFAVSEVAPGADRDCFADLAARDQGAFVAVLGGAVDADSRVRAAN